MMTPQEVEVWYVLPALRRELAVRLKEKELSQKRIAEILGVTDAAVCQYLKKKRASELKFSKEIKMMIKDAAAKIATTATCHRFEIQRILEKVETSGYLCGIHREHDDVPACCTVCMKGDINCKST